MKPCATIILNRNLPTITDRLCQHLELYDGDVADIYVVEAGSDVDNCSQYCTWHDTREETLARGLRYGRGMNYGLSKMLESKIYNQYEYFFLITNDTEFDQSPTISKLISIYEKHPRVGILSPSSPNWGERQLLTNEPTKYFWYIHNHAYLLRRSFIDTVRALENPSDMDFIFDGSNFRGYGIEQELIAKAYANSWAAAVTTDVSIYENESHLITGAEQIKTESYDTNLRLYLEEGKTWMRKKYGFNSHWAMLQYVKNFYEGFFDYYPEYKNFKI